MSFILLVPGRGPFVDKNGHLTPDWQRRFGQAIVLEAAGNVIAPKVGIGSSNPQAQLHIVSLDTAFSSALYIDTPNTSEQAAIAFLSAGSAKWQVGKQTDDNFFIFDNAGARDCFRANANGNVILQPAGGNVGIGSGALTPHSKLAVSGLPAFANNAAAITGGLAAGDFYRTGGDPDTVCVVH